MSTWQLLSCHAESHARISHPFAAFLRATVQAFEFLQASQAANGVRKGVTCSQSRCLCQERDTGAGILGGAKMRVLFVLLVFAALASAASAESDTVNPTIIPGAAQADCARLAISQ